MHRLNTAVVSAATVGFMSMGLTARAAQTGSGQSTPAPSTTKTQQTTPKAQQITITGCLRQTTDDPRMFALVPSADPNKTTGTSGTMTKSPLYRLEDKGAKLKGHTGQRIEVTGMVTPAKDEKGADIVMSRSETIGVPTTSVTTIDLRPAPRLDVTSVRKVAGDCPAAGAAAPDASGPGASAKGAAGNAVARAATVGAISEHPEQYLNQAVKVTGEVEKVFSPTVFSLDEDRVFSTGVDVLVLAKRPGVAKDNQRMTVTGTVRRFVRAEMQKEIVDFDLDPEWLVEFESRPVIIATEVVMATRVK